MNECMSYFESSQGDNYAVPNVSKKANNLALVSGAPPLTEIEIQDAKTAITSDDTSKLIGLISHLAYWQVFGHLNPLPLDKYHTK